MRNPFRPKEKNVALQALDNGAVLDVPDQPTVAEILQGLRDERNKVEAAEAADPRHRATDPDDQKARSRARWERLNEIADEINRYETWGDLADPYADAIHTYTAETAYVIRRYAAVAKNWRYDVTVGHSPHGARADFEKWFFAIANLYKALDRTEQARGIVARESAKWRLYRDAHRYAREAARGDEVLPCPEHYEYHQRNPEMHLPDFLDIGVYRVDRISPDALAEALGDKR